MSYTTHDHSLLITTLIKTSLKSNHGLSIFCHVITSYITPMASTMWKPLLTGKFVCSHLQPNNILIILIKFISSDISPVSHTPHDHSFLCCIPICTHLQPNHSAAIFSLVISPDISPMAHPTKHHTLLTGKFVCSRLKLDDSFTLLPLIISTYIRTVAHTSNAHSFLGVVLVGSSLQAYDGLGRTELIICETTVIPHSWLWSNGLTSETIALSLQKCLIFV